jgi:hypothetical protein
MLGLEKHYGSLPINPAEQSRLLYSIYKSHSENVGVLDAHRSYLAARDIGTINLLLFLLLPPFAYWATHLIERTAIYAAVLFASYLLFSIAAQIYATRFVQNVLATAVPGKSALGSKS